jgi:hypothetical protein
MACQQQQEERVISRKSENEAVAITKHVCTVCIAFRNSTKPT